jgi:hypothetical protein
MIRDLHSRLPDAETRMARAALEALAAVLKAWRLDDALLTDDPARFETFVHPVVASLQAEPPAGRLAGRPPDAIMPRLRTALTASLLRHVRQPTRLRSEFGPITQILKDVQSDPEVFRRVMSALKDQLPYFVPLASRVFWRTLNHLNAEQDRSPQADSNASARA